MQKITKSLQFKVNVLTILMGIMASFAQAEILKPLPTNVASDAQMVALGQSFFETKDLSTNHTGCSTCHNLKTAGSDKLSLAPMPEGSSTELRTLSVYNVSHNKYFGWSGQRKSLTDFLIYHIEEENVLGNNLKDIFAKIFVSPTLPGQIAIYSKKGFTTTDYLNSLTQYLSTLNTPSRFDRYLNGDASALTPDEQTGYKLFQDFGCNGCHFGVNFGGGALDSMGGLRRYFNHDTPVFYTNKENGKSYTARLQFNSQSDVHSLRPGVLRNIANRAPYFHDGSAETLKDAVSVMLKYQVGRSATDAEKNHLVSFLHALAAE